MSVKIFYSWQMDAPRNINKDFIHGALEDAINRIAHDADLTEAERDSIELDQDTQGVLGSPEISRVIFEKISAADVVVADVSLVADGSAGKKHLNSNVAIELGFAYGKLGDGVVLKVMNTHFGGPDSLPFDLRIRRHPVQYSLAPDADADSKAAEKHRLTGTLVQILRQYATHSLRLAHEDHEEVPFVEERAKFWQAQDILVPRDERYNIPDLHLNTRRLLYCRFIPKVALPSLSAIEAYDLMAAVRPLVSEAGWSRARNKWGVITHSRSGNGQALIGVTQLFRNREIWAVDAKYSNAETEPERIGDIDSTQRKFIPTGAVQREYPQAIDSMRELTARLGYGEQYYCEIGYSGAEGSYLARSQNYYEPYVGPFYDRDIFVRKEVSSDYATGEIMNDFWDKVFSEVGSLAPENLVYGGQQ